MVLYAEKKSKMAKKDVSKLSKNLNQNSTIANTKCAKKNPRAKNLVSALDKTFEDLNDSADFISPENKWKVCKVEQTTGDGARGRKKVSQHQLSRPLTEPCDNDSKQPKRRTSQRRMSTSSTELTSSDVKEPPKRTYQKKRSRSCAEPGEQSGSESRKPQKRMSRQKVSKSSVVPANLAGADMTGRRKNTSQTRLSTSSTEPTEPPDIKKEPRKQSQIKKPSTSSTTANKSTNNITKEPPKRSCGRKLSTSLSKPTEMFGSNINASKGVVSNAGTSLSTSETIPSPASPILTRRRTRSSEQKMKKAEENGDLSKCKTFLSPDSGLVNGSKVQKAKSACHSSQQVSDFPDLSSDIAGSLVKKEKLQEITLKTEKVKSNAKPSSVAKKNDRSLTKRKPTSSRLKNSKAVDSWLGISETLPPSSDITCEEKLEKDLTGAPSRVSRKRTEKSSSSTEPNSSPSTASSPWKTVKKEEYGRKNLTSSSQTETAEGSVSTSQCRQTSKQSSSDSIANEIQVSTVKCPTCKGLIPEEGLGRHILMCLKKKYQANSDAASKQLLTFSDNEQLHNDEIYARQVHEEMNKKALCTSEEEATLGDDELQLCHVCQKDLSHMNSMWKTKHINNCFDEAEKEKDRARKMAKPMIAPRQAVPACPMCGKQFKSTSARKNHLKKCAHELSVSPARALSLIAEQEKNFEPTTSTGPSAPTSSRSVRRKLEKLPDEQMQVALAMSSSLFEEQQKLNDQLSATVKNIHQRVNRELRKLKRSQKTTPESVPLLLTISREDQLARNAKKVDSIISEPAFSMHFSKQFPHSSLTLSCGDVYHVSDSENQNPTSSPSFWSKASLSDTLIAPSSFYVNSLMPPIQVDKTPIGSQLKPLFAIPGRGPDEEQAEIVSSIQTDSPNVPLTQTAVLLAELAQSNEEDLDDNDERSTGSCPIAETQGFYLSEETAPSPISYENQAVSSLVGDLCKLINDKHLSDVEFVVGDGSRVYGHKLLLGLRCPQVLQLGDLQAGTLVVEMNDTSYNTLMAFLRYIYAGRVDFETNVTADLLQLSRRFDLPQLASVCETKLQALIDEACYSPSMESISCDTASQIYRVGKGHDQKEDKGYNLSGDKDEGENGACIDDDDGIGIGDGDYGRISDDDYFRVGDDEDGDHGCDQKEDKGYNLSGDEDEGENGACIDDDDDDDGIGIGDGDYGRISDDDYFHVGDDENGDHGCGDDGFVKDDYDGGGDDDDDGGGGTCADDNDNDDDDGGGGYGMPSDTNLPLDDQTSNPLATHEPLLKEHSLIAVPGTDFNHDNDDDGCAFDTDMPLDYETNSNFMTNNPSSEDMLSSSRTVSGADVGCSHDDYDDRYSGGSVVVNDDDGCCMVPDTNFPLDYETSVPVVNNALLSKEESSTTAPISGTVRGTETGLNNIDRSASPDLVLDYETNFHLETNRRSSQDGLSSSRDSPPKTSIDTNLNNNGNLLICHGTGSPVVAGHSPSRKNHPLPRVSPLKTARRRDPNIPTRDIDPESLQVISVSVLGAVTQTCPKTRVPPCIKNKSEVAVCKTVTDRSIAVIKNTDEILLDKASSPSPHSDTQALSLRDSPDRSPASACLRPEPVYNEVKDDPESLAPLSPVSKQVFQEKEQFGLIFDDKSSGKVSTLFGGLLSAEKSGGPFCEEGANEGVYPGVSHLNNSPGFNDVPSGPTSQVDRVPPDNNLLSSSVSQEDEACNDSSIGRTPVSPELHFDNSNELFSESEDASIESGSVKVSDVTSKTLGAEGHPIEDSVEDSVDFVCFVSENLPNAHTTGMSSSTLCLADTICENSRNKYPETPVKGKLQQIFKSGVLNGDTSSFYTADTILDVTKSVLEIPGPNCIKVDSPRFGTILDGLKKHPSLVQETVSIGSPKNPEYLSPKSLSKRVCGTKQTDFGSDLEVKDSYASTSPKFSSSSLTRRSSNRAVKNISNLYKASSAALCDSWQRRKRKSCDSELSPPLDSSLSKKQNTQSELSESGLGNYFSRSCFNKGTNSTSVKVNDSVEKSQLAIEDVSKLVSEGSYVSSISMTTSTDLKNSSDKVVDKKGPYLSSMSMTTSMDLKNSPDKVLDKNQSVKEWLEIVDDRHCEAEVPLSNSPGSILDRNLDTFSRLSEDSFIKDQSNECINISHSEPFGQDSDTEMGTDSNMVPFFSASLEKDPLCLPNNAGTKTPNFPKKKFTFKRTQLKDIKSSAVSTSAQYALDIPADRGSPQERRSPQVCLPSPLSSSLRPSSPSHNRAESSDNEGDFPADVWDDFEDNGYIEDFVRVSSPVHDISSSSESAAAQHLNRPNDSRLDSPKMSEVNKELGHHEAFDSSFINDFICSSSPVASQTGENTVCSADLKPSTQGSVGHTPACQTLGNRPLSVNLRKSCRKQLALASPFTPMPRYEEMTTPDLLREMKKNGCRRMPRDKMVSLLQEIFQNTHQYETDSDLDLSILNSQSLPVSKPPDHIRLQTKKTSGNYNLCTHSENDSLLSAKKTLLKKPGSKTSKKGRSAKSGSGSPLAQELAEDLADSASDKSSAVEVYEESFLAQEDEDEDNNPRSQQLQQEAASGESLHDRLRAFVHQQPEIYSKILLYEPIDFDQLKKKIDESKIKCSVEKLLEFLDNQCITFKIKRDNARHGAWKPRKRRK